MNTKSEICNYYEESECQLHKEMYGGMNVNEIKKRLLELYNAKVSELEILKNNMEDARRNLYIQAESKVRQKEDENNLKLEKMKQQIEADNQKKLALERFRLDELYSKKTKDLEHKYDELEKLFEDRAHQTANKIIQKYRLELEASLEAIKKAFDGLKNCVSGVMRCQEQLSDEKTIFPEQRKPEVGPENRDCTREFKYYEDSKILQMEEFRELLEQQDKRIENIKGIINARE